MKRYHPGDFLRSDGRSCGGTSVLGGPWSCGSGDCGGRRSDCSARRANEATDRSRAEHERHETLPWRRWERAWEEAYSDAL